MQKILFLDFDGVLNSPDYLSRNKCETDSQQFNPEAIQKLNYLLKETGANVVISSAWRYGMNIQELQNLLASVNSIAKVVGKTEIRKNSIYVPRGHQIRKWLDENDDVESFVVLDDRKDMDQVEEGFINVDSVCGLSWQNVKDAIEILTNKERQ